MTLRLDDTIAALASAPGPGLRGILRISGDDVRDRLEGLFRPDDAATWSSARTAQRHTGTLRLKAFTTPVPADVYLWPSKRSYTGAPLAEIHVIGSPPLLEAVLSAIYAQGVRPARPGEFTLRAFLAGRVDLVQAEAVLGVIDAADHVELDTALRQLAGGVSGRLAEIRATLLNLLADLEAGLDFVDEDIEFVSRETIAHSLDGILAQLVGLHEQAQSRMQSSVQRRVVLAGLPNAGKSTLFNALAGRNAAIVSEIEGTTRDYLVALLDWEGTAIELVDTAGWESAAHGIMSTAQSLRGEQVHHADVVVWCSAANLSRDDVERDQDLRSQLSTTAPVLDVMTKCDLPTAASSPGSLGVSATRGEGLAELRSRVASLLSQETRGARQLTGTTAARSRDSLAGAIRSIQGAREAIDLGAGDEMIAVDLREALDHLGQILGAVYTDDILDCIFSKFCIGK